jgi:hypothetical protein
MQRNCKRIAVPAVLLVCLGAVDSMLAQQVSRLTQPVDDHALVTLRGTVHPLANAANDRGAASPEMKLERLQLTLKRSPQQEAALQQRPTAPTAN